MSKIRIHKKINLLPIQIGKENLINVFYGLIEKYNKQSEYKPLELTKGELWELTGFKGEYNSIYINDLINNLTKSDTYKVNSINPEIETISGSMFIITSYPDGRIKINIPEDFRNLIFYKKDIDLMTKAKGKKKLSIKELDYWDRIGKEKSKFLVLLKKADILGISGKYSKRLYALLTQFNKTGKYIVKWEDFKGILEIPQSYKSSDIDRQVLNKAKKELLKVGLKITKINKIKKGRSIIRIEIFFILEPTRKINSDETLEIAQPKIEVKKIQGLKQEIRGSMDEDLKKFKQEIDQLAKKQLGNKYYEFKSGLVMSNNKESINQLILKYSINKIL